MDAVTSILHDLHIEPGALLVNIVSFLLLLWLMKKVLFKPVTHFMDQRKQQVAGMIDQAEADREAARQERRQIEDGRAEQLRAAQEHAERTREQAHQEAEELRAAARERARETERTGHAQVEREREETGKLLKDELAQSASAMCVHILTSTLTAERHRALLEQFIADIEQMADSERASQ